MDDSAGSTSFLWQVPAKPVSVQIRLSVIDRMGVAVMEGFKSLPRRGLETGGLLLGTERRNGRGTLVEIDDFEPLECEHAFGPSYLLSATDRQLLQERLAWRKSSDKSSVVGFYRSHTRRDFSLTVEDIDLMTEWFSRESNVFLLLHSNGDAPPTAGFAIWEAKKIRSSVPYAKFEFARSILAPDSAPAPIPPLHHAPAHQTAHPLARVPEPQSHSTVRADPPRQELARPEPLTQEPPKPEGSGMEWWSGLAGKLDWAWVAAVALVLATLLLVVVLRRDNSAPPTVASVPLGLDVKHDGAALRVLWNHEASVVQSATRAVLWIGDGGRQAKLDLDPAQLAGGSVMYWPQSSDVNFRLEVFSPASHGIESLRAVGLPAPVRVLPSETPAETANAIPERAPEQSRIRPASGGADRKVGPDRNNLSSTVSSTVPPLRDWSPPAAPGGGQTVLPPSLPTVPLLEAPGPVAALPFPATESLPDRLPPAADPLVTVDAEPVLLTSKGGLLSRLHLVSKPEVQSGFVPPRPVRRPSLSIPAELRARARVEAPIDVRVYVDQSGRVEYAELDTEASRADRQLATLAVFSSRRWQFDPARIGNRRVPAEVVLRYRFGTKN